MKRGARHARAKGKSGGKGQGAGRKPTKRTKSIELTEAATRGLAYFIENLNLDPRDRQQIVSTILTAALNDEYDKWRNLFGNTLGSRVQVAIVSE